MDYINKRMINIPQDAQKYEYEDINYTVYVYKRGEAFAYKIYGGRRSTPDSYSILKNEEDVYQAINKYIQERRILAETRTKQKAEKKLLLEEKFKSVKVGDLFYTSWGYDQTNVDFYKLMKIKGKTGTFQRINSEVVSGSEGYMSAYVKAGKLFTGKPFTARFTGDSIKVDYGQRAVPTLEDTEHYSSWYA